MQPGESAPRPLSAPSGLRPEQTRPSRRSGLWRADSGSSQRNPPVALFFADTGAAPCPPTNIGAGIAQSAFRNQGRETSPTTGHIFPIG